ncbi:MAG TPA: hypothetical protein VHS78_04585 [Candidatus Elarobacter sp.]|jgi:hypothetical protein|nr:hypothetical protein [Candidatus Elarobacter sp.]
MILHSDLLEQARHLAHREPKRPKQASLRRAVSGAYYALFHLLTAEGTKAIRPVLIRNQVRRAYEHANMKNVCRSWARGFKSGLPAQTAGLANEPIEKELTEVAKVFIVLQEARHAADYDFSQTLTRSDSSALVAYSEKAFRDWSAVRDTPNAAVFLAALLFEKQWKGR